MKWKIPKNISLKYRIAIIIVLVEVLLLSVAFSILINNSHNVQTRQNNSTETIIAKTLAQVAGTALKTQNVENMQSLVDELIQSSSVEKVVLLDQNNRVIVSSDGTASEKSPPKFENAKHFPWKHIPLIYTPSTSASSTYSSPTTEGANSGTLSIQFSYLGLAHARQETVQLFTALILLGMIIVAIIGIAIGNYISKRIELLRTAAAYIANGEQFKKIDIMGNDEISLLGQTFNQMADRIEANINNLHSNQKELLLAQGSLEQRIIDRTEQLAVARDHALDANRIKSKFLANMSHELRTPLNAIIGYSELLSETANPDEVPAYVDDLDKIRYSGTHLLGLINQILDLSKIEAGKADIYNEKIGIKQLAYEAMINIKPIMDKNNNTIKLNLTDDVAEIISDKTKLVQILINLLQNAAKFTHDGTILFSVTCHIENDSDWIKFRIKDTGIGIDKKNIKKLFSEFTQADDSTTRNYGGSGLGLAICKKFSGLMGGDVTVESEVGVGSVFTLSLPQKPSLPSSTAKDVEPTVLNRDTA